tara:strand:- start:270 stop:434 length:165 start_codon:yes stop_codon:yes gene_type:complete
MMIHSDMDDRDKRQRDLEDLLEPELNIEDGIPTVEGKKLADEIIEPLEEVEVDL